MKCFIFDIGNVLADFDDRNLLDAVVRSTTLPVELATARDHELDDLVEKGLISDEEYVARLNASKGLAWTLEELTSLWSRVFTLNPSGRQLFGQAVQSGIPVYLLSNIAAFHIKAIRSNWPTFFDGVAGQFLSFEIGVRKPHPDIYCHVLEELGIEGRQCFFVDDLPQNVDAARSLGIQAYRFIPENHDTIHQAARALFGW